MVSRIANPLPARFWLIPAAIILGVLSAQQPASAASGNSTPSAAAIPQSKSAVAQPLIAVVSINDQRVTVWSGNNTVARSPISSGTSGHRTPTGIFSVIGKERYHESNLYSDAPMPFMQRITWSGVAMHAGHLPGYPASHGCIRMPEDFAQRLFGMTRTGMRVIVTDRDVSPISFAHTNLPVPTFVRETQVASVVAPAHMAQSAAPQQAATALDPTPISLEGRMRLGGPPDIKGRLLNPMERGKLEQGYTKFAALEAQADAQALLDVATQRATEARFAAAQTGPLDATVLALGAGRNTAIEGAADATTSPEDRARSEAARIALDAAYQTALQRRDEAHAVAKSSDAAAFHAAAEAKAALAERDALQDAARISERATEPVSIFISRREHRVYVRQGFEPVFEADIEIAESETPLGTHIFTAVAAPAESNALSWVAVTLPDVQPRVERVARTASSAAIAQAAASQPLTAANALHRVKFSDAVTQKISEKLWTGASLIISDYGISHETGKGTDFVILTRSAN